MFINCLRHLRIFPSQMAFNQTVSTAVLTSQISNGFCWTFGWIPLRSYLKIFLLSLGEFHTMYFHHIHPLSFHVHSLSSPPHPLNFEFSFFIFSFSSPVYVTQPVLGVTLECGWATKGPVTTESWLCLSQQLSNTNSFSARGEIFVSAPPHFHTQVEIFCNLSLSKSYSCSHIRPPP